MSKRESPSRKLPVRSPHSKVRIPHSKIQSPKSIPHRLLRWYARNSRPLPWRQTRDPYAVWVSEVMLQQTRVETVIPYYSRVLSRFPTVETLAKASPQKVLKAWENMGYYGRARNLHSAAKEVVARWKGRVPGTREELLSLPGIGEYTAAAVLCFAFGESVPAVDGNVRRVLSRVYAVREPLERTETLKRLDQLAGGLVPPKQASSFNQALMDLGATVCTPRNPLCRECPLTDLCLAERQGLQGMLPITERHAPLPHKSMTAALIRDGSGRFLMVRRPPHGLLGGLWKFPGGEKTKGERLEEALVRTVREEMGIEIKAGEALTSVKHAYTHFRITLHLFLCSKARGEPSALGCAGRRWVSPKGLARLPLSRAERKLLEQLSSQGRLR
jgi:A/G-specific adenine glycosylase